MNQCYQYVPQDKYRHVYPTKTELVYLRTDPVSGVTIFINPQSRDEYAVSQYGETHFMKSGNPYKIFQEVMRQNPAGYREVVSQQWVTIVPGDIKYPLRYWMDESKIVNVRARSNNEMRQHYREWHDSPYIYQPPLKQFDFNWSNSTPVERERWHSLPPPGFVKGEIVEAVFGSVAEQVYTDPSDYMHTSPLVSERTQGGAFSTQIGLHNFYSYPGSGLRRFAELHQAHEAAGHTDGLLILEDLEAKPAALTFMVTAALNADLLMIVE